MNKIWEDFKAFAFKGNVVDMAVGVVIGGAFGKIVTSIVSDLITPIIGYFTAGVDFSNLKYVLSEAVTDANGTVTAEEVAIKYGAFIQNVIDFFIIAICIFAVIRILAKLQKKQENQAQETPEQEAPSEDIALLTEIRDLLKAQHEEKGQ